MAQYRECTCNHYMAFGLCTKGREASHSGYCQTCDKYTPRENIRYMKKTQPANHEQKMRVNERY